MGNSKSWCSCYLYSLGMKGEVKGRGEKLPLLPRGEGTSRQSPLGKIPARSSFQEGESGCSLVVAAVGLGWGP